MEFREKLAKLVGDGNRSELARRAGLSSTAITDYLQKGYIPRADKAVLLARALQVPLDWLADDERDWPPPKLDKPGLADVSLDALMEELARRYRHDAVRALSMLEELKKHDWGHVAKRVFEVGLFEDPPADVARPVGLYTSLDTWLWMMKVNYDLGAYVRDNHQRLPGAERRPEELEPSAISDLVYEWEKTEPFLHFIVTRADMRRAASREPDRDPEQGRRYVLNEIQQAIAAKKADPNPKAIAKAMATDAASAAARGRLEEAAQQHTSNAGRAALKETLKDARSGGAKLQPKK